MTGQPYLLARSKEASFCPDNTRSVDAVIGTDPSADQRIRQSATQRVAVRWGHAHCPTGLVEHYQVVGESRVLMRSKRPTSSAKPALSNLVRLLTVLRHEESKS